MKDFNIMRFTEKFDFYGGSLRKKQYIGENCLKGGLGQFADLRGGGVLGEKSMMHIKLQYTCFPISHEVKEIRP